MINLLIVDDENHWLQAMKLTVDWSKANVGEIYTASSGYEALELLDDVQVGLVITDIKMPGMDGLALVEQVRERWPRIKCIILTGYADFGYAQQALRHQAVGYLLKPYEEKDLLAMVLAHVEQLETEWREYTSLQSAARTVKEKMPLLRNDLLMQLLTNKTSCKQDLDERFRLLQLPFGTGDLVQVMAIRLEHSFDETYGSDIVLMEYAVENIAVELLNNDFELWFGRDEAGHLIGVVKRKESSALSESGRDYAIIELQRNVNAYLKGDISIVMSREGSFPRDLPFCYDAVIQAFRRRIGGETNFYMVVKEPWTVTDVQSLHALHSPPTIKQLLDTARWADLRQKLSDVFIELKEHWSHSPEHLMETFTELFAAFSCFAHKNNRTLQEVLGTDPLVTLLDGRVLRTLSHLEKWVNDTVARMEQSVSENAADMLGQVVRKVQQFAERHLHEDVTLHTLAQHVFLNPSYLSRSYKAVTGESISNYLYRLKMEQAAHLLRDGKKKIEEVGLSLGYQYPQYFIKMFRKYYGMTPREFRDRER